MQDLEFDPNSTHGKQTVKSWHCGLEAGSDAFRRSGLRVVVTRRESLLLQWAQWKHVTVESVEMSFGSSVLHLPDWTTSCCCLHWFSDNKLHKKRPLPGNQTGVHITLPFNRKGNQYFTSINSPSHWFFFKELSFLLFLSFFQLQGFFLSRVLAACCLNRVVAHTPSHTGSL